MNDTPTPRTDIDTICDAIASKLNDAFNLYAWDDSKNHAKQIVMDNNLCYETKEEAIKHSEALLTKKP